MKSLQLVIQNRLVHVATSLLHYFKGLISAREENGYLVMTITEFSMLS
jgi:hypothetical protein